MTEAHPPMRRLLIDAILDAWALLQPIECLGCGSPDRACCRDCRTMIRAGPPRTVRCDAPPEAPVWCAADYAGPVRGAVLALKELGRVDAARALAPLLRAAVAGSLAAALAADAAREVPPVDSPPPPARRIELAPIPSTRRALARRGYDPVRLVLARTRLPRSPVLVVRRGWAAGAQKRRRRDARLAAQVDRFRTRGRLDGRAFIVVDDVATTGATLSSACTAIRRAGGTVLGCAVIAAPSFESRATPGTGVIVHSPEGSR